MQNNRLSVLTKWLVVFTVFLWASAFVGIRMGLESYSPGGLALFRFIVASLCMVFIFFRLPNRNNIPALDIFYMVLVGFFTMAGYHVSLNYGELTVPSGIASFIISQSPVFTVIFATIFLRERISILNVVGMSICIGGMVLILMGQDASFEADWGVFSIFVSALVGSIFTILQKPFLKKYHAIEVTSYGIWGGTLGLLFYMPQLSHEITLATKSATLAVIYLGIFPAALAYLAWNFILAVMPASRAVNFLYFMPLIATVLGWMILNEVPSALSLIGGTVALVGVWIVNHAYARREVKKLSQLDIVE